MKTKLIPFEPPKESVIYNPPLRVLSEKSKEYDLLAYIVDSEYPFTFKHTSFVSTEKFRAKVPDEPQRMTNLQVMNLLSSRMWMVKNEDGFISVVFGVWSDDGLQSKVNEKVKVSRIDKIEWIEPTTDLLDL